MLACPTEILATITYPTLIYTHNTPNYLHPYTLSYTHTQLHPYIQRQTKAPSIHNKLHPINPRTHSSTSHSTVTIHTPDIQTPSQYTKHAPIVQHHHPCALFHSARRTQLPHPSLTSYFTINESS